MSDVAAALAAVQQDGTTVLIPAGNCIWTSGIAVTQAYSFVLQGAGAVSGTGMMSSIGGLGADATIIQDNITTGDALIQIGTIAGKGFRLTGIAFQYLPSNTAVEWNGAIQVYGDSTSVRIDHNHFNKLHQAGLVVGGAIQGVIDHNQFDSGYADENQMRFLDGNWNGDSSGLGNGSWADSSHFGTGQFMFAENNNYQWTGATGSGPGFAFDCGGGGRFVFRNNALGYHTALQTHGTQGNDDFRGCRAFEFYNNVAVYSSDPLNDQFYAFVMLESGTSLWWGNTVTGFDTFIYADNVRDNTATYPVTPVPNGWGGCGSSVGPSSWDGNTDSTGYPCFDQIGRGGGDLITGIFPGQGVPAIPKVDSVTGTVTWPHQALDPVYAWGNTYNPVPQEPDNYWRNYAAPAGTPVVENRDFYLELPNYNEPVAFNGSAGVGQGPAANMPMTCTPGVAYWATDVGALYQCAAGNTWKKYYTPFTYPHPLTAL
jgi:hypothetical protein